MMPMFMATQIVIQLARTCVAGIVFVLTKYVSVHNPVFLETHTIPRIIFGYSELKSHSEKRSLALFILSRQKVVSHQKS